MLARCRSPLLPQALERRRHHPDPNQLCKCLMQMQPSGSQSTQAGCLRCHAEHNDEHTGLTGSAAQRARHRHDAGCQAGCMAPMLSVMAYRHATDAAALCCTSCREALDCLSGATFVSRRCHAGRNDMQTCACMQPRSLTSTVQIAYPSGVPSRLG